MSAAPSRMRAWSASNTTRSRRNSSTALAAEATSGGWFGFTAGPPLAASASTGCNLASASGYLRAWYSGTA